LPDNPDSIPLVGAIRRQDPILETEGAEAVQKLILRVHPFAFDHDHVPRCPWFEVSKTDSGSVVQRRPDPSEVRMRFPDLLGIPEDRGRLLPGNIVRLSDADVSYLGAAPGEILFCTQEKVPTRFVC